MLWKHKSHTLLPSQQIPSGLCAAWNKKRRMRASVCFSFSLYATFVHSFFLILSPSGCLSSTLCFIKTLDQSMSIWLTYAVIIITIKYHTVWAYGCLFPHFCLYGVSSGFTTSCLVPVTGLSSPWQELMAAEPKLNPAKITRKCQRTYYLLAISLSLFCLLTHFQCFYVNFMTHTLHAGQSMCLI